MEKMRLDRFLSEESELTRSEIKKMIRSGQVKVNGTFAKRPEQKIDPSGDEVVLSGRSVKPTGMVYLLLNKPAGVLSATEDRRARTVLDLIDRPYARKLFPVGRLDKDTEGLLLLTNDGMLAHNLLSPRKHVYKVYFAVVEGEVTKEDEEAFRDGIDIGEKNLTMPAVMRRLSVDGDFLSGMKAEGSDDQAHTEAAETESTADGPYAEAAESDGSVPGHVSGDRRPIPENLPKKVREFCMGCLTLGDYSRAGQGQSLCAVALREGKFHQIKRMFEARGKRVTYLKRIAMGSLALDRSLATGKFRSLTQEELDAVFS